MSMTDEDFTTAFEPVLRREIAKGNKLAVLGFMLLMAEKHRSEGRCTAEAIVKITPATPDTPRADTIEKPATNLAIPAPFIPVNTPSLIPATPQRCEPNADKYVVIGQDDETNADVAVGDKEREGGFYILGKPRTGKSTLLVSMALQDIQNGHGLLFIDPHYDAINDLLKRIPEERLEDVILLDPMDEKRSFGLNLLHCPDPGNEIELDKAIGRVRDVFTKAWGGEAAYLGLWLDKILSNSVYLLIENPDPGYTLVDIPLVVDEDTTFRNELLKNVKVTTALEDFWYREFDRLTKRDRTEQVGPALTRLNTLRTNHILRAIVGQKKSTIDFSEILRTGKIVLLRMPSNLDKTVQNLIGILVLSEFLYAVYERGKLGEDERPYLGVYCDEFQRFATPDFADLFMQTGKFKVMTVVAHQTREQFKSRDDPNRGATAASRIKALFTLSPYDANEMPLVIAREPPTETVYEQQLVISDDPIRGLLTGRHKPEIQEFVDKYLRHLKWRREDTREEIEGERLLRLGDLDEASLYGLEERMAAIEGRFFSEQMGALERRGGALMRVQEGTRNLQALQKTSNRLRLTFRGLNTFFIDVMEGTKKPGQEAFSDFLIRVIGSYSGLPEASEDVLELYVKLSYGDPSEPRIIPFDLARSQGLFPEKVIALTFQAEKKTEEERRNFQIRYTSEEEQKRARWRSREREQKIWDRQRAMEGRIDLVTRRREEIRGGDTGTRGYNNRGGEKDFIWYPANVYTWFMWLRLFPDIEKLVIPYRTAKFTETWKYLMADGQAVKTIGKIDEKLKLVKAWELGFEKYMEYMRVRVVRDLKEFLRRYQEGALVMLALLDCAGKGGWRWDQSSDISVSEFPGIEGKDPVEVWCLVEKLRVLMLEVLGDKRFSIVFSKYLESYIFPYHIIYDSDDELSLAGFQTSIPSYTFYNDIRYRDDVQSLEKLVSERWGWFIRRHPAAGELWKKISAPIRIYLLCRAADLISFGERYSSLPPAVFAPYEELVGALVSLSKDTKAQIDEAEEKEEAARERKRIEKECAEKVEGITYGPPAILEPRVLSETQRKEVMAACVEELRSAGEATRNVVATIDDFASFCVLLSKPENHIKIKGQYVEKQVRARAEIDMVNEATRLLSSVEPYTAYVRLEKRQGATGAWTGKVRMRELSPVGADALARAKSAIEQRMGRYTRTRREIRQEIEKRQEPWRKVTASHPPAQRAVRPAGKPVEPPPTRTSSRFSSAFTTELLCEGVASDI